MARWIAGFLVAALGPWSASAQEVAGAADPPAVPPVRPAVEELTREALDSIVVVYQQGRAAGVGATGTGFIVSPDGLIATNWHVINDRRQIEVELRDGRTFPVTEVHASDRRLDLALIRVAAPDPLPALELGDSDLLVQGEPVIALGNPRGLKFSVVEGVVSGFRDDIGESPFPYLQLAIPVEEGNSGGPVLGRDGRVQGIVTMKSMVTRNLGFAMPVNALRLLLEKPNPMPMASWATVGRLDPSRWTTVMGAQWTQRAGRILVRGPGDGFGGRSLCLQTKAPPGDTHEIEVEVKLEDESGAAGLVFAADGGDRHYGFYPSGGRLRLTRFDGPDVQSWTILGQFDAPSYRAGEWNRLRVRVEPERIICSVNGVEVVSQEDSFLRGGVGGLCKFRDTNAEFRRFRVGEHLEDDSATSVRTAALIGRIETFLAGDGSPAESEALIEELLAAPESAPPSLEASRKRLKESLERLDALSRSAVARLVGAEVAAVLPEEGAKGNLLRAGLLIARLDNPDLDPTVYEEMMDSMAAQIQEGLPAGSTEDEIVERVGQFMFEESGFHASRLDYYHRSNSYLNEVLDDREGIPITLSIIFLELAGRCGATTAHGVGLPGHFMVGYTGAAGESRLVDVYEGAALVTREEAGRMVAGITGREVTDADLLPVSDRDIIARMLRNLIEQEKQQGNPLKAIPYLEVVLRMNPDDSAARFDRALLRYQGGDIEGSKTDLRWLLQTDTPGVNRERLRSFYESL